MQTALDPEFEKLTGKQPAIEKIASGFRFTEGPVFSRRGYLLFSDIPERIMKWERGTLTVFRAPANSANGLTFDHQGRLLTCEHGRVTRTEKNGAITVLAETGGEPNDLIYAIDGSVYFTDPKAPSGPAVYQITRRGEARVLARGLEFPNGVALAPDQQSLYVADSRSGKLWVYQLAPDGALGEGRVFATAEKGPDGIKTDEAGRVWAATTEGIRAFSREGRLLGTIAIPERPSNLNWGEGFRNLYVTTPASVYRVTVHTSGTRTY